MIKFFSWLIVFSIALYFISCFLIIPVFGKTIFPILLIASVAIGAISFIVLMILLIKERIQDKKEEDNNHDLSKY